MDATYISIEKNTEVFELYKELWGNRGISGIRADTMTEAIEMAVTIEKSRTQYLYFIDIAADDIDFMPQLAILNEVTGAPILIATSNYSEDEHHEALTNGADFYAQYCDNPEKNINGVIAAVNSYQRAANKQKTPSNILSCGGILISLSQRKTFVNDAKIKLTGLEFDLLHYFMSNLDRALSYEQIYLQVWKEKYNESYIQAIKSAIKKLRKKISSDKDENRVIKNVRGFGYKMSS